MSNTNSVVITFRTDKPEAEIGLFIQGSKVAYDTWYAHRELAETIHAKIRTLIAGADKNIHDLTGIVCYQGPGSFTGLRIGISVANSFAYGLSIPICTATGDDWLVDSLKRLDNSDNDFPVQPFYGAPVHITEQKK